MHVKGKPAQIAARHARFSPTSGGRETERPKKSHLFFTSTALVFLAALCLSSAACSGVVVHQQSVAAASSTSTLQSLTCESKSVAGNGADACTVSLSDSAQSDGASISLSSDNAAVTLPAAVAIPAGARTAGFKANFNAVTSTQSATLTATKIGSMATFSLQLVAPGPSLSVNTTSLSFGAVTLNTLSTQSLALSSSGTDSITISSASVSGDGFLISGLTLPLTLPPGQTATLNVYFAPMIAGPYTGQLTIASNSSSNPTVNISLRGAGQSVAQTAAREIDLSWSPPADSTDPIAGYNIYRASIGGLTYQLLNASLDTQTSFADRTAFSGVTYLYYVTSVDTAGVESLPSNAATVAVP